MSSQGTNKASVSDEVFTTAQHVEGLLRELSPSDLSQQAKDAAPLAHWSKTGLSATSFVPFSYDGKERVEQPRKHKSRITFDIRFKHFGPMGGLGAKLSALPHSEVTHIDWILTAETWQSYQCELRKAAAQDARSQAQDYCRALGSGNPCPVELEKRQDGAGYPTGRHVI